MGCDVNATLNVTTVPEYRGVHVSCVYEQRGTLRDVSVSCIYEQREGSSDVYRSWEVRQTEVPCTRAVMWETDSPPTHLDSDIC